jgi:hypothetical protein
MQTPNNIPPIPTPDGNLPPVTLGGVRGDWQSAPAVVRSWAYPLTWLGIVLLPFVILGTFAMLRQLGAPAMNYLMLLFFAFLFSADVWLNLNLKKGTPGAWTVQIAVSALIILNSLVNAVTGGSVVGGLAGLAIHGYILSQWFSPETKAWFGRS